MGSNYEYYNQAISQEKQLKEIENKIKPQVEKQLNEVEKNQNEVNNSENEYKKNLKYAVISNENVDLKSAVNKKKQFQDYKTKLNEIKEEVKKPLYEIEKEKQRINKLKSVIPSPEKLESQGFKKEIRGNKIIYYKEDTYRPYREQRKRRETFRRKEYIYSADGTPIEFIERDDYRRDNGDRIVDEEKIIRFDSQGRVTQVRTFNDGKKDEVTRFRFNSDGSMRVETRDYERERRLKEKAQREYEKKLKEQRKYTFQTASVDWYGNSVYTTTAYNEKTGQWEKTTTKYTKKRQIPTKKISRTKVLQATKTPINNIQEQFKINSIQELGLSAGIPGVNQGTSTPEQIKAQQNIKATAITGSEVTFSFSKPKENEVNLNPLRVFTAAYQMGSGWGSYLASNVKGEKSIITDVKKSYEKVKKQGIVKTIKNVVVGTVEQISKDPFGFVGESLALGGAGKVGKQAIAKATTKVKINKINSKTVNVETSPNNQGLGIQHVEVQGSAEVTQGFLKKKTRTVEFEGEGIINKETRALGSKDPKVSVIKENSVSREITPADLYEGKINLRAEGKTTKVKVDAISQGNKQITNVNKETFVSETKHAGKLNNENLFLTKTENVKTGEISVSISKTVKSKPTTKPTQDIFATASESQTDIFYSKKDISSSKEKIVDISASESPKTLSISQQTSSDLKIINIDELKSKKTTPKEIHKTSNQREFTPGGQSQVFEQKVSQKSSSSDIASFENNFLDDAKDMFKTETKPTTIPISEKTIKTLVTNDAKVKLGISIKSSDAFSQTDLFSTKQDFSNDIIPGQKDLQKPVQNNKIDTDVKTIQEPIKDTGFKEEIAQQTSQKTVQDPIVETPSIPKFNSVFEPPVKPKKIKFGFDDDLSLDDPFSSKKRKNSHKGQFAGSLTALVQGIVVDDIDPNKKTTGLSKRAILRGRGF